ncbi:hypothetical protein SCHPADRAFT_801297, partial [Schizopora paradoxa]
FPPPPPSKTLIEQVINGWVEDVQKDMIEEAGCQVCGLLTLRKDLKSMDSVKDQIDLSLLDRSHLVDEESMITRKERKSKDDPICSLPGPVIDPSCNGICILCLKSLAKRKVPQNALARGLWIGEVPEVLSCLTYAEKLMVARVRTNHYVVRVSSGLKKMKGNAIAISTPIAKVY